MSFISVCETVMSYEKLKTKNLSAQSLTITESKFL